TRSRRTGWRTPRRSPGCRATRLGSSAPCSDGWRCGTQWPRERTPPGDGGAGGGTMSSTTEKAAPLPPTAADVEEAMRDVIDPELGINVVDLGLVYGVTVDQNNHAVIDMTLTSAACPLTDVIE